MYHFFSSRIPNTDHGAAGVFDSLESFYFSICDVS